MFHLLDLPEDPVILCARTVAIVIEVARAEIAGIAANLERERRCGPNGFLLWRAVRVFGRYELKRADTNAVP